MSGLPCPCSSGTLLELCCGRYHQGEKAPSALLLMRSRYSAFALGLVDYIRDTTHPAQQAGLDLDDIAVWSQTSRWLGLDINRHGPLKAQPPRYFVEFTAHWQDSAGQLHQHHERSLFVRIKGHWYFIQPQG